MSAVSGKSEAWDFSWHFAAGYPLVCAVSMATRIHGANALMALGADSFRGAVLVDAPDRGTWQSHAAWNRDVRRVLFTGDRRGAGWRVLWKQADKTQRIVTHARVLAVSGDAAGALKEARATAAAETGRSAVNVSLRVPA